MNFSPKHCLGLTALAALGLAAASPVHAQTVTLAAPTITGSGPFVFTYVATPTQNTTLKPGDSITFSNIYNYTGGATVPGYTTYFTATPVTTGNYTSLTFAYSKQTNTTITTSTQFDFQFDSTVKSEATGKDTVTLDTHVNSPVSIQVPGVPEPSTWAAFAFTGLGALGLMLKARKRRTVA